MTSAGGATMLNIDAAAASCRWTTGELAALLRAELVGSPEIRISRLDALERADGTTLTFIRDGRNADRWATSAAVAAIVSRKVEADCCSMIARGMMLIDCGASRTSGRRLLRLLMRSRVPVTTIEAAGSPSSSVAASCARAGAANPITAARLAP